MGISVGYPRAPGVLSSAVMTGNVTLSSSPGAPTFHLLYSLYSHCEGAEVPAGDPCALCERTARERPRTSGCGCASHAGKMLPARFSQRAHLLIFNKLDLFPR